MEDLNYIVSLGFSGADLPRALILAFFMAMLFAPKQSIWRLGVVALLIDKLIWPLVSQAIAGASVSSVFASLGAIVQSVDQDLAIYVVRYFGLTVMIGFFSSFRGWVHTVIPASKAPA